MSRTKTGIVRRVHAPTVCTQMDEEQAFRVWTEYRSYDEDQCPWKCIALFYFLTDALDFIADLQDRGVNCVFQSPADCRHIKATDRRVVYNGGSKTLTMGEVDMHAECFGG